MSESKSILALVRGDNFADQIGRVLPSHIGPERFARSVVTAIMREPKLQAPNVNQQSFFNSVMRLAEFGLEPNGVDAHLVPFHNGKTGETDVTLIVDYKGMIQLAWRSGMVDSIHAEIVRENDAFDWDRGKVVRHHIDFKDAKGRGVPVCAYAMCELKGGGEIHEVMPIEEIEAVRRRSRASDKGPWVTDTDEMRKKTVLRRLWKRMPRRNEFDLPPDADDEQPCGAEIVTPRLPAPKRGGLPAMPDAPTLPEATTERADGVDTPPPAPKGEERPPARGKRARASASPPPISDPDPDRKPAGSDAPEDQIPGLDETPAAEEGAEDLSPAPADEGAWRDVVIHVGKQGGEFRGKRVGDLSPEKIERICEMWASKLPNEALAVDENRALYDALCKAAQIHGLNFAG